MEKLVTPPARSAFFGSLWLHFYRMLARRYFECVWLREDAAIPDGGFVAAITHQSSWDSRILALWQHEHRPVRFCTHAHEQTLAMAPMMRWLGAFSAKGSSAQAVRDLLQFARECCEAGEPVCFFAEGLSRQNNAVAPLRRGFANVAIAADVPVVPVVIRYIMRREMRPEVFIAVGAALPAESSVRDTGFNRMRELYEEIERDVINDVVQHRYRIMLKGRKPFIQRAIGFAMPLMLRLSGFARQNGKLQRAHADADSFAKTGK